MKMSTSTDRKRLQRQRDREDPDRKYRKLDSIYLFGTAKVSIIIDDEHNFWFRAIDLANALEMEDPASSISHNLDKKYCKTFESLKMIFLQSCDIPNIHPKTTFVNELGMNWYVIRSNKPKAREFSEWVCGEVLPSIRKNNKYEIDPANNPYRDLNESLQKHIEDLRTENTNLKTKTEELNTKTEELKTENTNLKTKTDELSTKTEELKTENSNLKTKTDELKTKTEELKTENTDLKIKSSCLENKSSCLEMVINKLENTHEDTKKEKLKLLDKLFVMQPSCVPTLHNELKREFFVLYRKSDETNHQYYDYPYYACRVQLHCLEPRRIFLLKKHPTLKKILQLSVPNSVVFFNYIREQMPGYIQKGKGEDRQAFQIKDLNEEQMLVMVKNLYRFLHGELKTE